MNPCPIAFGLVICEKVIVEAGTSNTTLVSTFSRLVAERFPTAPQRITLYAVLTDSYGIGTIELVETRMETDAVFYKKKDTLQLTDRLAEVRVVFRLDNCSFAAPGRYLFTLLVDGEWVAQRELTVVAREAP